MSNLPSRSPGEYPGSANLDPQLLHPQFILDQYMEAVSAMTVAGRAEHLTDFAVAVEHIDTASYEQVLGAAKDTLGEAQANPEVVDDYPEGLVGLTSYMANATLNQELIAQVPAHEQNSLLVKLAVKRQDPALVPEGQKSQDDYLRGMAKNYGDIASARKIINPVTRALALKEVFGTLDTSNLGPADVIMLEEEAWLSLLSTAWEQPYETYSGHLVDFAITHGRAFIERMEDPEMRHAAYRAYAVKIKDGDEYAPDREWLMRKIYHEAPRIPSEDIDGQQRMKTTICEIGVYFGNPTLITNLLPGMIFEKEPRAIVDALTQKAIRELDSKLALSMKPANFVVQGRDYALYHIAAETTDRQLADQIPADHYRMLAYSVIAGKTQDPELKEIVKDWIFETTEPEIDDMAENFGAHFIINLNDPAISHQLLAHPNMTSRTISRVAQETNNIELALAIPHPALRGMTVSRLAGKLQRPDLLHMAEINPTMRANALRALYHSVVEETTPEQK